MLHTLSPISISHPLTPLSLSLSPQSGVKIDISEAADGVLSRVQITVNDGSPAGQTSLATADARGADEQPSPATSPAAAPQWNQFEFLLSDTTIRAS